MPAQLCSCAIGLAIPYLAQLVVREKGLKVLKSFFSVAIISWRTQNVEKGKISFFRFLIFCSKKLSKHSTLNH